MSMDLLVSRTKNNEAVKREIRELTNRRLSHDDHVILRDVTSTHAYMGTYQSRTKVDDVGEGDLQASPK